MMSDLTTVPMQANEYVVIFLTQVLLASKKIILNG